MKNRLKNFGFIVLAVCLLIYLLGYFSNWIGWNKYKKWTNRVATTSIEESKKRGVYVISLKFKIINYDGKKLYGFSPYIEKGFNYGRYSSNETVIINGSNFPYQLSFSHKNFSIAYFINKSDLKNKFDSAGYLWGYLLEPKLKDTIRVDVSGDSLPNDVHILIWE